MHQQRISAMGCQKSDDLAHQWLCKICNTTHLYCRCVVQYAFYVMHGCLGWLEQVVLPGRRGGRLCGGQMGTWIFRCGGRTAMLSCRTLAAVLWCRRARAAEASSNPTWSSLGTACRQNAAPGVRSIHSSEPCACTQYPDAHYQPEVCSQHCSPPACSSAVPLQSRSSL